MLFNQKNESSMKNIFLTISTIKIKILFAGHEKELENFIGKLGKFAERRSAGKN